MIMTESTQQLLNKLWTQCFGSSPAYRYYTVKTDRLTFRFCWNTEPLTPKQGKKWSAFIYRETKKEMKLVKEVRFKTRAGAKRRAIKWMHAKQKQVSTNFNKVQGMVEAQ